MKRDGWTRLRLKDVVSCNDDVLPESTPDDFSFRYIDIGTVARGIIHVPSDEITFSAAPSRARRRALPGDTIISTVRTYLKAIAPVPPSADELVFSTGFAVLRPRAVEARFLGWLLQSDEFTAGLEASSVGVSYPAINASDVMAMSVLLPDGSKQSAIADYLDHEIAQIDTLIAKQGRLIATLRERRIATITNAVTAGVRGDREMVSSGTDWFASTPTSWRTARLKHSVESSQTGFWGTDPTGAPTDVLCVRVADFDRPKLSIGSVTTRRAVAEKDLARRLLHHGDLLLEKSGGTRINPVGFVAYYSSVGERVISSNFITRLRTRGCARFWLYAHAASYATRLTARSVNQTTGIQNLDQDSYLNEIFPFPPESEQREIAEYLDRQTEKIDTLIAKVERFIELSKERRAALITAAVTGQLEIPAA